MNVVRVRSIALTMAMLLVVGVAGMGGAPGAVADPPPPDPQNRYLLDWGGRGRMRRRGHRARSSGR